MTTQIQIIMVKRINIYFNKFSFILIHTFVISIKKIKTDAQQPLKTLNPVYPNKNICVTFLCLAAHKIGLFYH